MNLYQQKTYDESVVCKQCKERFPGNEGHLDYITGLCRKCTKENEEGKEKK
jgi:formylmethanofuran dehydrogenase subunit E